jgi:penicillin-binding protein 2
VGNFNNPEADLDRFRFRLGFAAAFVLICFGILIGRFVWLQVIQHDFYQTRAEDNRIALIPIVPNRGVITDRNGVVLAHNYSAFTLEITPAQVGKLDETIDALAEVIDIQPKDRKRFKRLLDEAKNFESIPIRTRLSDAEVAKFSAQRYRFPGVEVKARLFRQYPMGPQGQNWGLPPIDPVQLKRTAYRPFIELLRANMRGCGALRIDHVMGLRRLWWVPPGAPSSMVV